MIETKPIHDKNSIDEIVFQCIGKFTCNDPLEQLGSNQ
jgi:hypothetical protein